MKSLQQAEVEAAALNCAVAQDDKIGPPSRQSGFAHAPVVRREIRGRHPSLRSADRPSRPGQGSPSPTIPEGFPVPLR
jgi:hypothetical protein